MIHHFKLWGPLRSGTNYLGRLMELNFEDVVIHHNEGGWKHGPPQGTYYTQETIARLPMDYNGHLLIIKNPFAWIDSMVRYNMMPDMDIWWYADQWNQHARELFTFSWRDDAILIKYERLIQFLQIQLREIEHFFELDKKHGAFADERRKMLRGGDNMKGEDAVSHTTMDISYYTEHRYMQYFSEDEIGTVRACINPYLIRQLNYKAEYEQLIF